MGAAPEDLPDFSLLDENTGSTVGPNRAFGHAGAACKAGNWKGFVPRGFIVKPNSGRCWCENADSATCKRVSTTSTWDRYDFRRQALLEVGAARAIAAAQEEEAGKDEGTLLTMAGTSKTPATRVAVYDCPSPLVERLEYLKKSKMQSEFDDDDAAKKSVSFR